MGIVLYEMLAGRRPFIGEHAMSVLFAIHSQPPEPLDLAAVGAPSELQSVIEGALAKDPAERYASAGEFAAALRELRGETVASAPVRRWPLWVAAGAVLVAIIAVVALGGRDRGPKRDHELAVQHNELAQDFMDEGEFTQARMEFRKSILADPEYPVPWNNLALMAKAEGNLQEADSLLHEALSRDSEYAFALLNLGDLRWDQGDYEAAETAYRAALQYDPVLVPAWNNLASLMILQKRLEEAQPALDEGTALEPDNPALLRNLARLRELRGDPEGAKEAWERVLQLGDPAQQAEAREALTRLGGD
jgi:FimV-like protein